MLHSSFPVRPEQTKREEAIAKIAKAIQLPIRRSICAWWKEELTQQKYDVHITQSVEMNSVFDSSNTLSETVLTLLFWSV